MNVKATTQKGFFGFAKKGQTEVTVAKEEESERYPGAGAQKKMPEEASDFPPEDIPIHVIYEDDDILVLNKQAGVAVHPTKGEA